MQLSLFGNAENISFNTEYISGDTDSVVHTTNARRIAAPGVLPIFIQRI